MSFHISFGVIYYLSMFENISYLKKEIKEQTWLLRKTDSISYWQFLV